LRRKTSKVNRQKGAARGKKKGKTQVLAEKSRRRKPRTDNTNSNQVKNSLEKGRRGMKFDEERAKSKGGE